MNKKEGFSLIEVLVFISIFSVFFVVAIAAITVTLRNMKKNEHKVLATRYAEELQEWLKTEKEIDWYSFSTTYPNQTYCFNLSITAWPTAGSCSGFNGIVGVDPSIFKRELVLTVPGSNPVSQVNATITVSWQEIGQTYQVVLNSSFNSWE